MNQRPLRRDRLILLSELAYKLTQGDRSLITVRQELERTLKEDLNKSYHLENIEILESNRDMMVAVDHQKKELYIVVRGTDLNSEHKLRDIFNDFQIVFTNKPSSRLNTLTNFYDKYSQQFQDYTHHATGHSLGGSLAEHLTVLRPGIATCETFNSGGGWQGLKGLIADRLKGIFHNPDARIICHRIKGDLISFNSATYATQQVQYSQRLKNAHSLENFVKMIEPAPTSFILQKSKNKQPEIIVSQYPSPLKIQSLKHSDYQCISCLKIITPENSFIDLGPYAKCHSQCLSCAEYGSIISNGYTKVENMILHPQCSSSLQKKLQQYQETLGQFVTIKNDQI